MDFTVKNDIIFHIFLHIILYTNLENDLSTVGVIQIRHQRVSYSEI